MVCPRCGRELRKYIIGWHECEEWRVYSNKLLFCPNCGKLFHVKLTEMEE